MAESKEEKRQLQSADSDIIIQSHRISILKEAAVGKNRKAAEAQYELACCYAWSVGVETSPHHIAEARKWLQTASANGHSDPFSLATLLNVSLIKLCSPESASTAILSRSSSSSTSASSLASNMAIASIAAQHLNPSSLDLVAAINGYLRIAIEDGRKTPAGEQAEAHLARLLWLFYKHNMFDLLERCGEVYREQGFNAVQINALLVRLLECSKAEAPLGKEEYDLAIAWFADYALEEGNYVPSKEVVEAFEAAATNTEHTSAQYILYHFYRWDMGVAAEQSLNETETNSSSFSSTAASGATSAAPTQAH